MSSKDDIKEEECKNIINNDKEKEVSENKIQDIKIIEKNSQKKLTEKVSKYQINENKKMKDN